MKERRNRTIRVKINAVRTTLWNWACFTLAWPLLNFYAIIAVSEFRMYGRVATKW